MVEEKKIDFFKLNAVIEKAEAKFEDDEYGIIYTEESLNALKEALIDAGYVRNNKDATQTEVDAAADKLNEALAGLEIVSTPGTGGDGEDPDDDNPSENPGDEDDNKPTDPDDGKDDEEQNPPQDDETLATIEDLIDAIKDLIASGQFDKDDADIIINIIKNYYGYGHWYTQDELEHLLYWLWNQMDHVVVRPSYPSYTVSVPQETLDGWKHYSSGTFYYYDGVRARGFAVIDGETYYFNRQGFMQTGWVWVDDDEHQGWWYFDEDGKMVTGWLRLGNTWYYLDTVSGRMYDNGLAQIDGQTYYFYDWGGMANDWWYEAEDGWYFFKGDGSMQRSSWRLWKGKYYYLTASGLMATNTTTPDGYYVNADGVWVE